MSAQPKPGPVAVTKASGGHRLRVVKQLLRRRTAVFSGAVIAVLLLFALTPVSWLPHSPTGGDQRRKFQPPIFLDGGKSDHLLGTDLLGRDILSMLIAGARYTLGIVIAAALIGLLVGVTLGLTAAYFQGWYGSLVMRLADVQLAFPVMVLLIAVVAAFGASVLNLILILGITAWAPYARVVYTSTLALKEREFVEAARASGLTHTKIMVRHLLPNLTSVLVVLVTFELAQLVLVESALSFLGLGVQPPNPSWGAMIADGRQFLYGQWWASALPGLFIVFAVLAFSLLGDELRDVLDPEGRES
ncbi:ABC transporter permease [Dactylosporangium roseum]|uniref:ABC transporter permease n=1 Tax=Dactylosporangium roseum TaxID=47989 RepID=A0ABY5YZ31_9ACTN|nr:ABC transporter permease [Dactylosporangium roseum]UWZ34636.1 ABC transporter permease [Dactylosporangium roseum]